MPTGYTHDIAKGISFKQYAMGCARAFGALIAMRDDPHDAEIPESFEPDNYHLRWAEEARARLAVLEAMTPEQKNAAARVAYEEELASRERMIQEATELRLKYRAMLDKVVQWVPPSDEFVRLKEFMMTQIHVSIENDCTSVISYYSRDVPMMKPSQQWWQEQVDRERSSIARYEQGHQEEIKRVEKRNLWIRQLRESLKDE